jgi:hypothetical protein
MGESLKPDWTTKGIRRIPTNDKVSPKKEMRACAFTQLLNLSRKAVV